MLAKLSMLLSLAAHKLKAHQLQCVQQKNTVLRTHYQELLYYTIYQKVLKFYQVGTYLFNNALFMKLFIYVVITSVLAIAVLSLEVNKMKRKTLQGVTEKSLPSLTFPLDGKCKAVPPGFLDLCIHFCNDKNRANSEIFEGACHFSEVTAEFTQIWAKMRHHHNGHSVKALMCLNAEVYIKQ